MNFYIQSENTDINSMEITEWLWRPIRSFMAIANHRLGEKNGSLPVEYHRMEDYDYNAGFGIRDPEVCRHLAKEMIELINSPGSLDQYGMTVDLEDGEFVYTYPIHLCTSCIEHRETKEVVSDISKYKPDELRSCFRVKESSLLQFVEFLKTCGGFGMP